MDRACLSPEFVHRHSNDNTDTSQLLFHLQDYFQNLGANILTVNDQLKSFLEDIHSAGYQARSDFINFITHLTILALRSCIKRYLQSIFNSQLLVMEESIVMDDDDLAFVDDHLKLAFFINGREFFLAIEDRTTWP